MIHPASQPWPHTGRVLGCLGIHCRIGAVGVVVSECGKNYMLGNITHVKLGPFPGDLRVWEGPMFKARTNGVDLIRTRERIEVVICTRKHVVQVWWGYKRSCAHCWRLSPS